jgi:hypothetical protein
MAMSGARPSRRDLLVNAGSLSALAVGTTAAGGAHGDSPGGGGKQESGGAGKAAGDRTLWISPLGFVAPGRSALSLERGAAGDTLTVTTSKAGDLQWLSLPLSVPADLRIKKVIICYRVANERSLITQVRLGQERIPPTALVVHDDAARLSSTKGACYESVVRGVRPEGAITLALRMNFTDTSDAIDIGAIGLVLGQ